MQSTVLNGNNQFNNQNNQNNNQNQNNQFNNQNQNNQFNNQNQNNQFRQDGHERLICKNALGQDLTLTKDAREFFFLLN